ncbi:hypothetical protein AJ80_01050 [Polytolypa hystricis UAMH7299]|uniref:Flavin reductase like domain-containing protein n=1 Tax=Polytolypa hystricis (strain UAMH7299) TaxID=1447883 RepID=A0A2B7Z2I8_POLH7|nr:hypothetical protein AJ80_01050 [Polytolypa hystricis UAMH7299]
MLGGCSAGLRSSGRKLILQHPPRHSTWFFNNNAGRVLLTRQCPRRYYGRILRTILSKHIESFADTIRPIIPIPHPPTALRPVYSPPNLTKPASIERRTSSTSRNTPAQPIIIDEEDLETAASQEAGESDICTQVRLLMRRVPHPVAIITSTDPHSPAETAFKGMTVSSFNTVTLYPKPIISFNVKLPSETYNTVRSTGRFLVHLLTPKDTTAHLAREFARGNENILLRDRNQFFQFLSPSKPGQRPVAIHEGEPPLLAITPQPAPSPPPPPPPPSTPNPSTTELADFPFVFECQYLPQSIQVGSHVIVVATVVNILRPNPHLNDHEDTIHDADDLCLTYADTRFWKIGGNISPSSGQKKP